MSTSRQEICARAAAALAEASGRLGSLGAVVGFDGFVDEIIAVVDKRHGPGRYDPVRTIAAMGQKIGLAAGESSNYELVVKTRKLGGNGPIMANALACLGLRVTYVGSVGDGEVHPAFRELAERAEVVGVAEPGHTDALEFDDGKIMLGKYESLAELDWERLSARLGAGGLGRHLAGAALIGMVNWTMLPWMSRIWERMLEEVMPDLPPGRRTLFVDLADPEKRTRDDIREALRLLGRFQQHAEVILGLNLKEATEIADVLGFPARADSEAAIEEGAREIRRALGLDCVVIHPRRAAAAATADASARFAGPFVQVPLISTGAGDHFNAGFCLGRILGLGLEESLCAGVGTSGYYVRSGRSPSAAQLAEFVADLPPPETILLA